MIDLQAIRTELSQAAPVDVQAYDFIPGSANLPCLVVGLPETVTFDASLRSATVAIPVFLAVGPNVSAESEHALLSLAATVATSYLTLTGASFRSCRVVAVTDFQTLTIGSSEAYGCTVDLDVIANT